jgi:hypothetical protein
MNTSLKKYTRNNKNYTKCKAEKELSGLLHTDDDEHEVWLVQLPNEVFIA